MFIDSIVHPAVLFAMLLIYTAWQAGYEWGLKHPEGEDENET